MIRRILNIIVSLVLLVATAGIIVNVHYSNDELYSIGIFSEAESCCLTECDCCTEEVEIIQLHENYLTSNYSFDYIPELEDLFFAEITVTETNSVSTKIREFKVLPPGKTIKRCSTLQVFLL